MSNLLTTPEYERAVNSLTRPQLELLNLYESLSRNDGYVAARRTVLAKLLSENLGRKKIYCIRTLHRFDITLLKKGLIYRKLVTRKIDGEIKTRTLVVTVLPCNAK